jgi:hypothetical protein
MRSLGQSGRSSRVSGLSRSGWVGSLGRVPDAIGLCISHIFLKEKPNFVTVSKTE